VNLQQARKINERHMYVNQVCNSFHLIKKNFSLVSFFALIFSTGCKNNNLTWNIYKADAESSSYSPLELINKENVHELKVAWIFNPGDTISGSTRLEKSECNPIVIDNIMYATSARHRLYAINASNGKLVWSFDPFNGAKGGGVNRGVTYWEDGDDKRILFTAGDNLFAVNAKAGKLITSFGDSGKVSMNVGIRDNPELISIKPTSPGIIYKDLLIIGNEVSELYGAQPGYVRAYNVRTGKLEWTFHTIPKPGEPGYETWPKDAWKYAGGANDWGGMSVDEKRGMVFLATGSPTYDFYGADRKGENLFGNCVVALNANTGKYIWHFQTVHHDLWDYDLPAPPNLVTIIKDAKEIDAVAQTSKIGFLYVLDRETGQSLFPVEERKVPASDVPGEEAWPTQPFPLKPAAYVRQYMTVDDLTNFSAEAHDSLIEKFKSLQYEGLFTPPSLKGTLNLPGTIGGSEWGGAAYDPATHILYVNGNNTPEIDLLQKIEPGKELKNVSPYSAGKKIYMTYCASCHKENRNGDAVYPSLIDLQKRMTKDEVLNKIEQGSGRMPGFSGVIKGQEESIIAFLFQAQDKKFSQRENDLSEIQSNNLSHGDTIENAKYDTAIYLNVTPYADFTDRNGHPAIKPPWGTLNAINLNTGEYEWKIPVGNDSALQEKGATITGLPSMPGPIVTAGGIVFFCGAHDKKFFAFDKTTGKLLWETTLPAAGSSTPCTYMTNGKQYVALSVGGNKENPAGYVTAFSLP
jgi:quinoprotein glucose dehydrogenase